MNNDIILSDEYYSIIFAAQKHGKLEGVYGEIHHIIPRCCGGSNDKENLVWLTAQEHFAVHKILAIDNPWHNGLIAAWWNMSTTINKRNTTVTEDEYACARAAFVESISGENNVNYGKHWSDETNRKRSETQKGKPKSKESILRMSEAHKGKHQSESTKKILSEKLIGKGGKKVLCIETNKIYNTGREACNDTGVNWKYISDCCCGRQKSAGGLHWKFYEGGDVDGR